MVAAADKAPVGPSMAWTATSHPSVPLQTQVCSTARRRGDGVDGATGTEGVVDEPQAPSRSSHSPAHRSFAGEGNTARNDVPTRAGNAKSFAPGFALHSCRPWRDAGHTAASRRLKARNPVRTVLGVFRAAVPATK